MESFFWHDYETFGADPACDRPAQFAGLRTDLDLNPIGEPVSFYCQPGDDSLPHPEACLITGITPQRCLREGLSEPVFAAKVLEHLGHPHTCGIGYNTLRFDDEVTRHLFFRNFIDPYAREWQNGNSRWDLIDVLRLAHAIRPEGIEWPVQEGVTSFRLEALTAANDIHHGSAHDALSDVEATIDLARRLKQAQPRLFQHVFSHRGKQALKALVAQHMNRPLFHVSSRIPARLGCCALVAPIAWHPVNANAVIALDLRVDPGPLELLSPEELRHRLFSRRETLEAEGLQRLPVKLIHLNKAPVLVEPSVLKATDPARLQQFELDVSQCLRHAARLPQLTGLAQRLKDLYAVPSDEAEADPELTLYTGGFFSDGDRRLMEQVRRASPDQLAEMQFPFQDRRLQELLFRYRARNFPDSLSEEEMARWENYRYQRLNGGVDPRILDFKTFFATLEQLARSPGLTPAQHEILQDLQLYGESILPYEF